MKRTSFRKMVLSVLAALILMFPVGMNVFAGSGSSTKYVVSDMNFRSGPGTNYSIIGSVPRGSVVSYTNSYNGWDQIIYNGYVGFIHGGNLSDTAPSSSYSSSSSSSSSGTWTVRVSDGYLALRSGKAYDYSNEIGKLWTGDTVEVWDSSDSKYWYVYASHLGKSGYVNKNYLYSS
ncbi:MAG: SH3 domain-containing protein, partial [Lachnospiraceae bacterium]|nr:SH3 domain-containing protein [Lachnospiraceae bacterium]